MGPRSARFTVRQAGGGGGGGTGAEWVLGAGKGVAGIPNNARAPPQHHRRSAWAETAACWHEQPGTSAASPPRSPHLQQRVGLSLLLTPGPAASRQQTGTRRVRQDAYLQCRSRCYCKYSSNRQLGSCRAADPARNGAALDLPGAAPGQGQPRILRSTLQQQSCILGEACKPPALAPCRVVPRSAACRARSGRSLVNCNLHRFVRARRRPRCTSAGCLGTPVSVWASPRPPAPRSRQKVGNRCALGCRGGGGSWCSTAAAAAAACRCLTSSAARRPCHCSCRTRQWTGDKARWAVGLALAGQAQA